MSRRLASRDSKDPPKKIARASKEDSKLKDVPSSNTHLNTLLQLSQDVTLAGFPVQFSSTHSKHVFGNIAYAVDVATTRKYRQFVNKKRGFNKVEGEVVSSK
ncbi:hypothetical protein RCL1_002098 [Eukaryota sp. TZLM3-RCL]